MKGPISRYFQMIVGVIGAISSGALIVMSVKSGRAPGPGMAWWITDSGYSSATDPSQYWFMLFLFAVGLAGFAWLAWRAYRD